MVKFQFLVEHGGWSDIHLIEQSEFDRLIERWRAYKYKMTETPSRVLADPVTVMPERILRSGEGHKPYMLYIDITKIVAIQKLGAPDADK